MGRQKKILVRVFLDHPVLFQYLPPVGFACCIAGISITSITLSCRAPLATLDNVKSAKLKTEPVQQVQQTVQTRRKLEPVLWARHRRCSSHREAALATAAEKGISRNCNFQIQFLPFWTNFGMCKKKRRKTCSTLDLRLSYSPPATVWQDFVSKFVLERNKDLNT